MNEDCTNRYRNKVMLAPMVRVGTLPMRLLALDYGADLVYSEEIIDHKLVRCKRVSNGTTDFIDVDNKVVFRTCDQEKDKVILQIGTSDPDRALAASKLVEKDVSGIDINMGCPKDYSVKGGMGAALLKDPCKIAKIISHLSQNLEIPTTAKMRVLPQIEDTVKIARIIESSKAAALAVHGRTKDERPGDANRNDFIRIIANSVQIPVIASGGSSDIHKYDDIEKFSLITNASSTMIARAAQDNCSIFRRDGMLNIDDVIKDYLHYAIRYNNEVGNSKYCIQRMLGSLQATDKGKACLQAQSLDDICKLWPFNS